MSGDLRPSRRSFLLGALALTACGRAPATAGPQTVAFPRTVVDAVGNAVLIPAPPQRIVVASEYNALDSLLALGVPPLAAVRRTGTDWPWAAAAGAAGVPRIAERSGGPSIEELASYAPDLVFFYAGDDTSLADRVGALAPTVQYNADDARACLRVVADALGIPERAEPLIAGLDARIAAARDRIRAAGREGATFATFTTYADGSLGYFGMGTDATILLTGLGLRPVPLLAGTQGYGQLALERIAEIDADVLLGRAIEVDNDAAFDRLEGQPLFRALPGVAAGRYRRLSMADSYAIGQSSILSWAEAVDLLERIVLELPA